MTVLNQRMTEKNFGPGKDLNYTAGITPEMLYSKQKKESEDLIPFLVYCRGGETRTHDP